MDKLKEKDSNIVSMLPGAKKDWPGRGLSRGGSKEGILGREWPSQKHRRKSQSPLGKEG